MRHLRVLHYLDEVARAASIRKAADRLHVTASAVNRRIMDLEEEIGAPLLERRPRGVRLTAAGEIFVRHVRQQVADVERVKSQIEDLKGLRRGTVRIACSQALAFDYMPRTIAAFRARYPEVAFDVKVLDHERAMAQLADYGVDLVLVFRPPFLATFQPLARISQRLAVLMSADHPLSRAATIRLRDCAGYRVALPDRSFGGRQLLDEVCARARVQLRIVAESNSFELLRGFVLRDKVLSFQIEIGADIGGEAGGIVARIVDGRDMPRADLVFGQLRGRNLPLPSAVFAEFLGGELERLKS
jgi:DNA-binding transcriptional LysR family regulator